MRVDVHAHHYPREVYDLINTSDGTDLRPGHGFASVTFDERADMLKAAGIDVQVLSLGTSLRHVAESPQRVAAARLANDVLADITRGYPGRFRAFGSVPLPEVAAAVSEAERCLDELGMVGISLPCTIGDRSPDDPAFEPFWAALDRRGAVVFFHPVLRFEEGLFSNYGLTGSLGSTVEDSLVALRLLLSGVTTRFPGVKIVVPHLAGGLAANYGRVESRITADALRGLLYDTASCTRAALRCACEVMGAEQLVFGSDDYTGKKTASAVQQVVAADLGAHETEAIMGETAARILGIGAAASQAARV